MHATRSIIRFARRGAVGTQSGRARALKPDGLIMVQTPCYPEDQSYAALRAAGHPFLEMLQAREHLYLFSRRATRQLFEKVGLRALHFGNALFPYDIFFVASRRGRAESDARVREEALLRSPASRLVHALVQLDDRARDLAGRLVSLESDRQDRIRMIEVLNAHVAQNRIDYEASGRVLAEQQRTIETLTREVERISADSEARLHIILEQQATIEHSDRQLRPTQGARDPVISEQTAMIESLRQHAAELPTARQRLHQRRLIRLLRAFRFLPRE